MLEVILIVYLCRKLAAMMKAKGRSAAGYVVMLVGFWIGGEILGAIVGTLMNDGDRTMGYLFALVGAALGAIMAFLISHSMSSIQAPISYGFPVVQRADGPSAGAYPPAYPPGNAYSPSPQQTNQQQWPRQ